MSANVCPECHGQVVFTDGEIYCTSCGLVVEEELIDYGGCPDRSSDGSGTTNTVTGSLSRGRGLGTEIDVSSSVKDRAKFRRMGAIQRRIESDEAPNLGEAITNVSAVFRSLELNSGIDNFLVKETIRLCNDSYDAVKGLNPKVRAAACADIMLRSSGDMRTHREISYRTGEDQNEIIDAYFQIAKTMDFKMVHHGVSGGRTIPIEHPKQFVRRFCQNLDAISLPSKANDLLDSLLENCWGGQSNSADAMAASVIYVVASREGRDDITQSKVSEVCFISKTTLTSRVREVRDYLKSSERCI